LYDAHDKLAFDEGKLVVLCSLSTYISNRRLCPKVKSIQDKDTNLITILSNGSKTLIARRGFCLELRLRLQFRFWFVYTQLRQLLACQFHHLEPR
jgi:hypothetical protein